MVKSTSCPTAEITGRADDAMARFKRLEHGLLVEEVKGAAARAGVRPGDVVLSLNGQPIDSVEQVRAALAGKPKHVAMLIQRNDRQVFVPVELG